MMTLSVCTADVGKRVVRMLPVSAGVVVTSVMFASLCQAQAPPVIAMMAANEVYARQHAGHFAFTAEEKSDRTGGHLWRERVVEVDDGTLRRLIAVDGRALSPEEAAGETRRLDYLVSHPEEYRRLSQAHKDDEAHATALLELLPRAYVLTPAGTENGCTRFHFVPNPSFSPVNYEERVGAALEGTVSLKEPINRLCKMQGTLQHPVNFGFGILGKVQAGGTFTLERTPVIGNDWKSKQISVHIGGKILMMKSIAKEQETMRTGIQKVPENLSLPQAMVMLQP